MSVARIFRQDERGATAVEFALIALPLIMLLFGIIEYGRLQWTRGALESVATSGARCIGIGQTECALSGVYNAGRTQAFILQTASSFSIQLEPADITIDNSATCNGVTGFAEVTLRYTFETALPFIFGQLGTGVPLTAVECFPHQSQP